MKKLFTIALLLVTLTAGCCVTDAAATTAQVAAVGNDRYTDLATSTLDGSIDPMLGSPVTKEDLAETPPSVRAFLTNLLNSLHTNRVAWHSLRFQLDEGDDPNGMGLTPVTLPAADVADVSSGH